MTRAAAPARTLPPRPSTNRTAGSTKTCDSDRAGRISAASSGPGPSRRRITSANGAAVARSIGWFSAATASGSHNRSQRAGGLAVRDQPLAHRLAGRRRLAAAKGAGHAQRRQPIPPGDGRPAEDAGEQVPRAGQRRAAQLAEAAGAIGHRDAQAVLDRHQAVRADPAQEGPGVVIAAEQDVLAVVHPLAARLVAGGEGAPAEHRPGLGHDHPRPGVGQRTGSAQAGAAGADDHDVHRGHDVRAGTTASTPARISVRAQVVAAMIARCGRGTRTTSENTSKPRRSIRCRMAK